MSISTSRALAAAASEGSVRTTPLTCGCQASVAINTRMGKSREFDDSRLRTINHGYFRRVTSQKCRPAVLFVNGRDRPRNCHETILAAMKPFSIFRANLPKRFLVSELG